MNWVKYVIKNYVDVLKKYAIFKGRATRTEFWYFQLVNFLITFIIYGIILILSSKGVNEKTLISLDILYLIYSLGTFLPQLGVMVRRLHDTGRSGWWYFIILIPIIGIIIFLIFLTQNSKRGSNEYGENPKEKNGKNSQSSPPPPPKPKATPKKRVRETQVLSRKKLVPENDIYPVIELFGEHDINIGRNNSNNITIDNSYLSIDNSTP